MFSVNGPSGPTSRSERRRKTDAELAEEETRKELEAQRRRERFFQAAKPKEGEGEGKVDDDNEEDGEAEAQPSAGIFKGCRIVFNGRTGNMSSYFLAKLVEEHGGNVSSIQMTKPSRITHMVGSNLSASKADKALKKLGGLRFVTADWILQSVKRGKHLPEFEFLMYKDVRAAAALQSAFAPSSPSTPSSSAPS